ncbi:hypothetical protein [Methylocella sp.]|jgi:hypothetical protein|uniref:hypothetical protein n=1 Tax=Methylocella sp. TaxID=1978226 RepID=UPI003C23325F
MSPASTTRSILEEAEKAGVTMRLDGDKVRLKASVKPPDDLLAKIRANKASIVDLLKAGATPPEPEPVGRPTISPSDRAAQLAFWRNMPPARPGHYIDDCGIEWPDHLGPGAVN